jgi:hypothetical protein
MASVQLPQPSLTVADFPGSYLGSSTGNVAAAPVIEAMHRLEWAVSRQPTSVANRSRRALLDQLRGSGF